MTAEICDFSTPLIPPVTIVTEQNNFHTLFPKNVKKIIIDYFKGLLMTHLDIFMSGKNLELNGLTESEAPGL